VKKLAALVSASVGAVTWKPSELASIWEDSRCTRDWNAAIAQGCTSPPLIGRNHA